ncbi:MAG: polysaccharide deacetylase family protein, partial [Acidobacteria bacterium]|nr:polysaccharide deacetylase family protein [Acidobacteriota bacterium]
KFQTHFLEAYYRYKKREATPTGKDMVITFDDGFLDNWIYVFPLLKKYNVKATIFVNPEFVDTRNPVRKNLEDYWNNKAGLEEIDRWGYLSWEEMRIMEAGGLVDIQSHTLTHTKYFVSDKITGFHRPGSDCLHVIGNLYPEKKPYYIEDPSFETSIPYGYPLFEEASAMIAGKVTINEDFNHEVIERLRGIDWHSPLGCETGKLYRAIEPIYNRYRDNNNLVIAKETEAQTRARVAGEIGGAKEIIDRELNKRVEFCGWPFGDTNDYAHHKALGLGFLATTAGKREHRGDDYRVIPQRTGLGACKNNRFLTMLKALYKIKSYQGRYPYYGINKIYDYMAYGRTGSRKHERKDRCIS